MKIKEPTFFIGSEVPTSVNKVEKTQTTDKTRQIDLEMIDLCLYRSMSIISRSTVVILVSGFFFLFLLTTNKPLE